MEESETVKQEDEAEEGNENPPPASSIIGVFPFLLNINYMCIYVSYTI